MADPTSSTLMDVGFAVDKEYISAVKKMQISATASGESGNLLRLIRPRIEALGWDNHHGIKLRVLNPASAEECFWLGDGGPIRQIIFAVDTDGLTSWLAVRRAESTTILRPSFRHPAKPSTFPTGFMGAGAQARLFPNPLLSLKIETTGGRPHADVSFNPWYIRQFAIVDQQGYWSIWDIEGQSRKRINFDVIRGKSGHIHDERSLDRDARLTSTPNGWGRVLWAGGVSTLIVCERRSLAVFSLKGQPKRLFCPDIIDLKSAHWILDVKRSKTRLDEIFVLTTSHIFWIQIHAVGEEVRNESETVGAEILLSCRHFRDGHNEMLKLEVLLEDGSMLSDNGTYLELTRPSMRGIPLFGRQWVNQIVSISHPT